jgi:8-oxo-dGTP diphosphatase
MNILFERWRAYLLTENNMDTDQVSKVVLHDKENKILLLKSDMGDFKGEWDLPGGHIHSDETDVEGLLREVKEETGLDINNPQKVFKEQRITYFKASMPSAKITLSHEHSGYDFFELGETQKDNFETSKKFKKAIKKAMKI